MIVAAAARLLQAAQNVLQASLRNITTSIGCFNERGPIPAEPSFNGSSATYLEQMYNSWLRDPSSVHVSWDAYFRTSATGQPGYMRPPNHAPEKMPVIAKAFAASGGTSYQSAAAPSTLSPQAIEEHMHVQAIIRNYQVRGHLVARTSPLEDMFDLNDKTTTISEKFGKQPPEVILYDKINSSMWNNPYRLPPSTNIGGQDGHLPLKEIIKRLELTYCRHIGIEYMHINDAEECNWIRERFEVPGIIELKKTEKRLILTRLAKAVLFEAFLQKKWSSEKRFGLEGCEVLIPCMKFIIDDAAKNGAEMAVLGMAHRGRLNVLANVCHKPLHLIYSQFRELQPEDEGAGDVKYHLGVYNQRVHPATKQPFATVLVANPSHLEMVNPVCAGRAKAEQFYRNDTTGNKVIPIIVHGDAAFAGEGIVYETINFANLANFHNGGTIHVCVNNQVGFTTDPWFSRSSQYSTDVGKVVDAPIFHVNADDPESAVYVAKVAAAYRAKYHKDVVIDLVGYRRHGHNETDEPMFTQPLMYTKIKQIPNIFEKYSKVAIKQEVATDAEVKTFIDDYEKIMEGNFQKAAKHTTVRFGDWIDSPWPNFFKNKDPTNCPPTGISMDVLTHISKKFSEPPPGGIELHKALLRVMHARAEMVKNQTADWAIGEALAIGSILKEGIHVRLSGEDVERGTFSHRHHTVHHQTKEKTSYTYLKDLYPDQAVYTICNSPISEYGTLGFEHGYSMAKPDCLVIWEAQFGDFANNAQPIFDNMIASGQWKWMRQCGMVILLPHGLEGQGPEHSSARIERYLQLSSDNPDYLPPDSADYAVNQLREINWIVANCTVPANLFHLIRRQVKLPFRKPLILMTPKSLLRHPEARSKFDEMIEGTEFQRIIPATGLATNNPSSVKRLIFCNGKVYFEFMKIIKEKQLEDNIAVARVEQICPFPFDLVQKEANKYSNAKIAWGQEEHKNSGCWTYVQPRLETAFKGTKAVSYIGRAPSASTASGNKIQYQTEYKILVDDVTKNL